VSGHNLDSHGNPNIGGLAGFFEGNLQVNGQASITSHASVGGNLQVLDELSCSGTCSFATVDVATVNVSGDVILTNQDCAEDFDVEFGSNVESGTVMALDERGLLQESRHAYDKRVAGVVSGAGEFNPGLILGRSKMHGDNRRAPVANAFFSGPASV
jgi:hypothetical protein